MPASLNSRHVYASVSVALLGLTFALLFRKRLSWARSLKSRLNIPQIFVISNCDQWHAVADRLRTALATKQVIGLDCEWKAQRIKGESSSPVALLQLATYNDLCVLIRLNKIGKNIPDDLRLLLKDKSILKVGVAVNDDAKKLMNDNGLIVEGCLDLRHLVDRVPKYAQLERKGLKALAESVAIIRMNKSTHVRMSDWEADELSPEQIQYAAEDAMVSTVIYKQLMTHLLLSWPERMINKQLDPQQLHKGAYDLVGHLIDHRYRNSVSPAKTTSKLTNIHSALSGKQQTRAYCVRQTPLYHNCQLQAPDGEPLCTCDIKKALWYLERDLAVPVSEDPLVVRLKFEPTARPILDNKYYIEEKINQCVVCGRQDALVRKIIVPHEYRKFFPTLMKKHLSHDVLLLCLECHIICNNKDGIFRQQLSLICGAPLGSGPAAKTKEDPQLRKVKSAGRALLRSAEKLPEKRKLELLQILMDFYQVSDITEPLIHVAAEIETNVDNESFVLHGKKVVEYYSSHDGLLAFESLWRKHFLDSMNPRYLPNMWSVDHNHQRLALQVAENKDYNFDIKILGPLPVGTDNNMTT